MVGPLSTVRGLGTWGRTEGLEVLYGLSPAAGAFVNNPLNYQRVQVRRPGKKKACQRFSHRLAD